METKYPWKRSQKLRNEPAQRCAASASFHANHAIVAPMNTFWTTALAFPGPAAGIRMPRRFAKKRKAVISTSRPTSSSEAARHPDTAPLREEAEGGHQHLAK